MKEQKIKAIILRSVNHKEKDKILTALSLEQGLVTLVMRGVRAGNAKLKFASLVFCFAEYNLTQTGDMWLVTGAQEIEGFFGITKNPASFIFASACLELADTVSVIGEVNAALFLLTLKALKNLSQTEAEPKLTFLKFCLEVFNLSGYNLAVKKCSSCGADFGGKQFLNLDLGSLECGLCRSAYSMEISRGAHTVLRLLNDTAFERLINIKTQEVFSNELINVFAKNIENRFNRRIKSLEITNF